MLEVQEIIATSTIGEMALWQYLLDLEQIERITARKLPVDTALPLAVSEPRALGLAKTDGTWVRIGDVRAALEARAYDADASLVLEVDDPLAGEGTAAWALRIKDGVASACPTDMPPDLRIGIADLASIYTGAVTCRSLNALGRVACLTHGAVELADALFSTPDQPWFPEDAS